MVDKTKLDNLPQAPGCYLMHDKNDKIIYIGKAKNLYNRVRSYFVGSHNRKTEAMISQIADFEYIITSNEKEAFILEINLIKKHRPHYNILLMDDKRYPYICLTKEKDPKIFYTRELNKNAKYFGPYPNPSSAKSVCDMLNKIFPLRKCQKIPKKECLYYHLGQCLGPCINDIEKEKYDEITSEITSFLNGNIKDKIKSLEKKMKAESLVLNYEKAKEYRNMIWDLQALQEKQKMELALNDTDIFGYATKNNYQSIQVFHVRDYKMVERNGFLFDKNDDEIGTFINFINQFYLIESNPIPKVILTPEIDINLIAQELRNKIVIPKQGKKKEFVDLVTTNALEKIDVLLKKEEAVYNRTYGAIVKLGEILNIQTPRVIEAFDNSNIQGASSVSAMVCYKDGVSDKSEYRKYKVKTVVGADDFHTMEEVITRRYKRLKEEGLAYPNLIVVDGGKPQVTSATQALQKIDVQIPILGLVKDDNHKTRALYFNDKEIEISKRSDLFLFLEAMQDEVHRYAITFHHETHNKDTFKSSISEVKGVGEVRKREIMKILGDVDFEKKLNNLSLTAEQKKEILEIYKQHL